VKVRYHPLFGWLGLLVAMVTLPAEGWLLAMGEFSPGLLVGPALGLVGAHYLTRTYFSVSASGITVRGTPLTTLDPGDTLRLDHDQLVVFGVRGNRRRVRVRRWLAHPDDWQELSGYAERSQAESPQ
jgi:hypothetical protein